MLTYPPQVAELAASENHWAASDVEVTAFDRIQLPPCQFYAAHHKTLPAHDVAVYAILPDGQVVSSEIEGAVRALTHACGPIQANAGSWAEVLVRFHTDLSPGRVLHESMPPGREGAAPSPVTAPTFDRDRLHFFVHNDETMRLYEVEADVADGHVVDVRKTDVTPSK